MENFLDFSGLSRYTEKIKAYFANLLNNKVDKVSGKELSTNDLTNALKQNYDSAYSHTTSTHAPTNAEKNTIVAIKQNGRSLTPDDNRIVDLGTVLTGGEQTSTSTADGGSNVYTFSDGSTITVKNGSKGSTGATPTIKAAAGTNIGSVGTPTVTASTSGTTTTFTFNNLKGDKGDTGTNATTTAVATTSANGLMSKDDKAKLDGIASEANKTTIDSALSSTSTNPVQNKVINTALSGKANSSHTHTTSQISDFPSLGNASERTIKTASTQCNSGWENASERSYVPDMSFIAFWNGAYMESASNLSYCSKGAFGTAATKNSTDFASATHTHNVSSYQGGINYSDAMPSTLTVGMFWIGNAK